MATTDHDDSEVLTVEAAATLLRISRNAVYTLSRRWQATGGTESIPSVEQGRGARILRRAPLELLAGGAIAGSAG